jgi:hydrogenase maturation protein HypF
MVSGIEEARQYCRVSDEEAALLESPQSPIVLLWWRAGTGIYEAVAPNQKYLGVMLPYTPLHHLLLAETGLPLVMTSGNLSEEPIARDNEEALRRLAGIADYFLLHNRDIYSRYDDSVLMVPDTGPQLIRRARGYAPYPIHLDFEAVPVLGCGAEEKNTFCLIRDGYAFLSQHIGDMENLETLEHYRDTIKLYQELFRIEPAVVAHDLHPEYLATRYARERAAGSEDIRLVPVQHHHAHIVSCMVDNGVAGPVIGVAFDGTGYGADGRIWGGEFLVCDRREYRRLGHLEYLPLPGGAVAIKKPYRTAIGSLLALLGEAALSPDLAFLRTVEAAELDIIKKQVQGSLNTPLHSSMGRLFDVVAVLVGVCGEIDYEGQAAIELEMLAYDGLAEAGESLYPCSVVEKDGVSLIRLGELFDAVIQDLRKAVPPAVMAARFHNTVANLVAGICRQIARQTGIDGGG